MNAVEKKIVVGDKPKKTGVKKKKYSIFLVTVNTNMVPNEQLLALFDSSIPYIFKDHLIDYLVDKTKGQWAMDPVNPADIIEHTGQAGIEVGERVHRLHAHVVLKITHMTRLHVNPRAIEKFYMELTGKKFFVDVKGAGNDEKKMEDYIKKQYDDGEQIKKL